MYVIREKIIKLLNKTTYVLDEMVDNIVAANFSV